MRIRKAKDADLPQVLRLARRCDLDYAGMESDSFWVAADGPAVVGIVGLKEHPDCLELCALGVEEKSRGTGLGKQLVSALMKNAPGEVFLATIIPLFFEKLGFRRVAEIPASMVKKSDWCRDCRRDLCTVMVKGRP